MTADQASGWRTELVGEAIAAIDRFVLDRVKELRHDGSRDAAHELLHEAEDVVAAIEDAAAVGAKRKTGERESVTGIEAAGATANQAWRDPPTWVTVVEPVGENSNAAPPGDADDWDDGALTSGTPPGRMRIHIVRASPKRDEHHWTRGYQAGPDSHGISAVHDHDGRVLAVTVEGETSELRRLWGGELDPMAFGSQTLRLGSRAWVWWHSHTSDAFPFVRSTPGDVDP